MPMLMVFIEFQSLIGKLTTRRCIDLHKEEFALFQSLIGKLTTCGRIGELCWNEKFQSLIGKLTTDNAVLQELAVAFQSLIGKLTTHPRHQARRLLQRFNPS
ncbi:hypothetical protein DSY2768 [Desulfitobacterium hafniense Y51]|uniref:Uncharacterized protein n=1 Tax=Desulfitobacterium hafniense (strain Y51) TaxID=138119 RepID=Q24TT5_DESHY|nr:hypothetical protein DSY2768 [Desulfitobacterium hafniense Y51]